MMAANNPILGPIYAMYYYATDVTRSSHIYLNMCLSFRTIRHARLGLSYDPKNEVLFVN